MPKSKNPYKPYLCLEGLPCDEIGKAYEEGQQNPDPKQYANKKELEKAIRESYLYRHLDERKAFILFQIIQNHGLEE